MTLVASTNVDTGETREISILDVNGGVVRELTDREFAVIAANILDPNTTPKAKRSLTIKLEFMPKENRASMGMKISVTSKLAAVKPFESDLVIGGTESAPMVAELTNQIPGQLDIEGLETVQPNVIHIEKAAQA